MPLYQYECSFCKSVVERFHKASRIPKRTRCKCGRAAKRVIAVGGIQCDSINDVKWLESARASLQTDHEMRTRPIESRGQYKRWLKEHGLVCRG